MVSQSAEYSLRAVVCLASAFPGALKTRQIAARTRVPGGYLSKVLQSLSRAGLIVSQRGINGGHRLARQPQQITLLDVVHAAQRSHRIRTCPLGGASHGTNLCALHRRLDDAAASIESSFAQTTIADVLADTAQRSGCEHRLCQ
jgi:Rrf2 family protein